MKKTYRNMALAAACVLTATGLWGCSTSVQIPDTVKVQQGDSSDNRITVSGMEEVKAVPDMAQIQYSVYTQAATAQECQEENAGKIITASVASGVNELDSVQYLCSDYDEKYQEALKMAVEMAKNKADAMAEAAGMTVVKAVNISEDGYYPQARYNTAGASAKQMMMEDAAADMGVMPGEVSIEAQVSVTFEME